MKKTIRTKARNREKKGRIPRIKDCRHMWTEAGVCLKCGAKISDIQRDFIDDSKWR